MPKVQSQLPVNAMDLANLRASGLNDATIRGNRLRTENGALVFPYRDLDGKVNGFARTRPHVPRVLNGKPAKYEQPKGSPLRAYFPAASLTKLRDGTNPVFFTEGEKKAIALSQIGLAAVGIGGVWCGCKKGTDELIDDLAAIDWSGRDAYIVFDYEAKAKTRRDVDSAGRRLAKALRAAGAREVYGVDLPPGPNGGRQGVDDFLVAHGDEALRELIESAHPVPASGQPPMPGENKVVYQEVAEEFLEKYKHDGVATLRSWHGDWWRWDGLAWKEVPDDEVKAALVRLVSTHTASPSGTAVNDILMVVRSQIMLPATTQPPSWLSDGGAKSAADYVALQNGVLHLSPLLNGKPVKLRPLTPRFFATAALPFGFDPKARCPRWRAFLESVWGKDAESVSTLQDFFGYALSARTDQQKIGMLIGPPRSGKGTIANVLTGLVGQENACSPTLASLSTQFGLQSLIGKSLAVIADARLSGRTDISQVVERLLSISGEDRQTIDRKYKDPWTGKLGARFLLLSNEVPRFTDASTAIATRMVLLRL
ncbi:MAG: DUF3854 domain-containing protein, partial [Thermoguttaceae bacterium]